MNENNKVFGSIYKITNNINGKCYVGQTIKKTFDRINAHRKLAEEGKSKHPFYNAIRKYGWENFKSEILEEGILYEELNDKEIAYSLYYNALYPNGYCLTIGGGRGKQASQEVREKISKSNKGHSVSEETRKKIGEANKVSLKGKKRLPETIKKMLLSRKWYKHSKQTREKISQKHKGKLIPKEVSEKISRTKKLNPSTAWNKGKKMSAEFSKNASEKMKELWKNPQYKENQVQKITQGGGGAGMKGKKQSPETIERRRLKLIGRKHSEETKKHLSEIHKGKVVSEEVKLKIKETVKKRWEDPKFREMMMQSRRKQFNSI